MKQHEQALKHANEIRCQRSAERHRIRALPKPDDREALAILLTDPPAYLARACVFDVMQWPCYCGPTLVNRWLVMSRVGFTKTVQELTPRQRKDLARCLVGLESVVRDEVNDRWNAHRMSA